MNMNTVLKVEKREAGHRSTLTQLRNGGAVPGVLYGFKEETTPVQVNAAELTRYIQKNGRNGVYELEVEGKKINAVINEFQMDALKGRIIHLDFLAVDMTEELEVEVPIALVGTAAGTREGGVIMQPIREVTIKVKPADIPEVLEVDVTELGIGDAIDVASIRDKFNFEILSEDEETLATVTAPTLAVEDEEGDEEAAEEPPAE